MKLDAKTVAALKLDGKRDAIHFDDQLAGFGYRIRQGAGGNVRRSWIAQYRRAGGSRRVLLGSADVLSAEQARQAARKVLAAAALGGDPQGAKAKRRAQDRLTLRAVVDEYLATKQGDVRPRSFIEIKRYLTGPYFKALHSVPIDAVTRKDVAAAVVAVTRQRGTQAAYNARSTLSAFFAWAMTMGLVEAANPVIGAAQPKTAEPRDRVLGDDELAAIWKACQDDDYGRVIKLLVLTGCRRAEVGGMCWAEINTELATWTIPSERAKNGRRHVLPLVPMALDIIEAVPQRVGRDQLFGERHAAGFSAWASGKKRLDQRCGITEPWVVHDLRRSAATKLADIGVQPHIIEQILNHQGGHKAGVAGVYNRSSYTNEVRAALATWSDYIRSLVDGGERRVIPLRG